MPVVNITSIKLISATVFWYSKYVAVETKRYIVYWEFDIPCIDNIEILISKRTLWTDHSNISTFYTHNLREHITSLHLQVLLNPNI